MFIFQMLSYPVAKSPNFYIFVGEWGQGTTLNRMSYYVYFGVHASEKMWLVHATNWLFAQTSHIDVVVDLWNVGYYPIDSYIFHVSRKSVYGSRSCRGQMSDLPLTWPFAYTTACTSCDAQKFLPLPFLCFSNTESLYVLDEICVYVFMCMHIGHSSTQWAFNSASGAVHV